MNKPHLQVVMKRLVKVMPKAAPNFDDEAIIDGWWKVFRWKDEKSIILACRALLETQKFFPTISELRGKYDEIELQNKKNFTHERLDRITRHDYKCEICEDSGMISAQRVGTKLQPYTFRCSCNMGFSLSNDIPGWFNYDTSEEWEKI